MDDAGLGLGGWNTTSTTVTRGPAGSTADPNEVTVGTNPKSNSTPIPSSSFRRLVNRDGTLPCFDDFATSSKPASVTPGQLVQVIGLERGRLVFEGVVLNGLCSLRKLTLKNVSGRGTVVVRLGSTLGDQLRWQSRNDNLNILRESRVYPESARGLKGFGHCCSCRDATHGHKHDRRHLPHVRST